MEGMDDVSSPPPLEALLEHRRFVRALARGPVRDAALAEDLEQETRVAALEDPPRRGARAWLRAVARNLAFKSHRSVDSGK